MNTKKYVDALPVFERVLGGRPTFGDLVEAFRVTEEISQADLAKKMGISRSHLCDIEKGRRNVTLERAVKFAKVFGYPEYSFVAAALEDLVRRAGLKKYKVHLEVA
jgi:transcriptional regulator with XRE-family HTH domain